MKKIFTCIAVLYFYSVTVFSQTGLIINEVSQGNSGAREYVELIAIAPSGTCFVDIRNWIIDDNNGDFSGGPVAGAGIASGHIRFTNDPQWQNVPTGSIILIYNSAAKNLSITLSDDPSDSNNDKVYVLPSNSALLEACTTRPAVGNAAYTPCTYGASNWNPIGLANDGDVIQTRTPTAVYFHGLVFGDGACNCLVAGPGIVVDPCTATGCIAGKVHYFAHNIDDNYNSAANYSIGTVPAGETPGTTNNTANDTWRNALLCVLPLPSLTLKSEVSDNQVTLYYHKTGDESAKNILLQHSTLNTAWENLSPMNYNSSYTHTLYDKETHFYRLLFEDKDGNIKISNVISAVVTVDVAQSIKVYPNPASNEINIKTEQNNNGIIQVFNLTGQNVYQTAVNNTHTYTLDISAWKNGMYMIRYISTQGAVLTHKFIKTDE